MRSMTAYAYKEFSDDKIKVSAEIKCYNSRFLDLYIHVPHWLSPLETRIRRFLSSKFTRGKVDLNLRVKEENTPVSVLINENAALAYKKAIRDLAKDLGIKEEPSLALILGFEGVLEVENDRDIEKYWSLIEPVIADSAEQAEAERIREGKYTEDDILSHIALLEESVKSISLNISGLKAAIKENLRLRFAEFFGDKIDDNRILAETAVLLMKYGISEELSRLSSHLSEFRLEVKNNASPGKKLDFLSQEINREINTIGSKTPIIEVSRAVVEMKNALENIREQLRNVE